MSDTSRQYDTADDDDPRSDPQYAYKASVLGAAWHFRLKGSSLEWEIGRRTGRFPLETIRRVRMSFRPATLQPNRFVTEIWSPQAPKLTIASVSFKSVIEQERLDGPYAAFILELHRRLAASGAQSRYDHGTPAFFYWIGLVIFAGAAIGLLAVIVHALQTQAWGGAAFIAAFFGYLLWQIGTFFHRNRPGTYRPDALPDVLVPKA